MSVKEVERLLIDGGSDKKLRAVYNEFETKDEFVTIANQNGYTFSVAELDAVLKESGDSFESFGNPRKKAIWWY